MKKFFIIVALLASTAAHANDLTGAPSAVKGAGGGAGGILGDGVILGAGGNGAGTAAVKGDNDYTTGWCRGWSTEAKASAENFQSWQKFLLVANPKIKDDKSTRGEDMRSVMEGVARYVLMPQQPGKVTLGTGEVIDCTGVSEK